MNKEQRKRIGELVSQLETIKEAIEELESEERDKFDNMPEGIQNSDKGEAMEVAADALNAAADEVDAVVSSLNEAVGE